MGRQSAKSAGDGLWSERYHHGTSGELLEETCCEFGRVLYFAGTSKDLDFLTLASFLVRLIVWRILTLLMFAKHWLHQLPSEHGFLTPHHPSSHVYHAQKLDGLPIVGNDHQSIHRKWMEMMCVCIYIYSTQCRDSHYGMEDRRTINPIPSYTMFWPHSMWI